MRPYLDRFRFWYYPEARRFASPERAREATALAGKVIRNDPWRWRSRIPAIVVFVLIFSFGPDIAAWAIPGLTHRTRPIFNLIGIVASMTIILLFERKDRRRTLRQILWNDGVRICPNCGYDLRGSPTDTCSECGRLAQVVEIEGASGK